MCTLPYVKVCVKPLEIHHDHIQQQYTAVTTTIKRKSLRPACSRMRVRFWAAFATLFRSNAILRDRAAQLSNIGRSISGVYRLNHQAIVIPRSLACTTGFVRGGHPRFENEMGGQPHPAVVK